MLNMTKFNYRQTTVKFLDLIEGNNGIMYELNIDKCTLNDEELSKYVDALFCRFPIPTPIFEFDLDHSVYTLLNTNYFLIAAFKYMSGQLNYTSSIDGIESIPFLNQPLNIRRRLYETYVVGYAFDAMDDEYTKFIRNLYRGN